MQTFTQHLLKSHRKVLFFGVKTFLKHTTIKSVSTKLFLPPILKEPLDIVKELILILYLNKRK